jgi:HK97 family phage major capsid protein
MDPIVEMRGRLEELAAASNSILARADEEGRELTSDEAEAIDANTADYSKVKAEVERRERVQAMNASASASEGRKTSPVAKSADAPRASVPASPKQSDGLAGFRSAGEFFSAVRHGSTRGGDMDNRLLQAAATTYGNEGVGADGGFAVPADVRSTIMARVFSEDSLIGRTDRMITSSNSVTLPTDMSTPWQSSGGVQATWEGEAAAIGQSKVALEQVSMRLHKLAAIVPMSEELLEDAPAMGSYLQRKVAEKFDFKLSHAIAWGTGVGQPLGFMNSPALVTQAAEGAQTVDTINAQNVVKMLSRLPAQNRSSAVWLIHPDAEPQLPLMTLGNAPVYMPPGGMSSAPFGTLLGRPVLPHQVCETVGDVGDIMLVDLNAYLSATKTGGLKTDVSMHVYFEQDVQAFRFTLRVAGMPWWSAPITSRDGAFTQSPFVALAAR